MKKTVPILVTVLLIFFFACSGDEECRKNRYVNLKLGLYHSTYNETKGVYEEVAFSVDSLTSRGIKTDDNGGETLVDSILYDNKKSVGKLVLPLDKSSEQSKYLVVFNDVSDTITVLHQNYDYYLSLECGCIKTFSIDTVLMTNNFIDSVKIINHNVTNVDAEHIKIYN